MNSAAETDHARDIAHTRVAIVGAGFSGLGIAIALGRAGIEFAIFERRADLGGTWLDNTYPGCKCDVPSHLYSFSFAPNPDWSSTYSPQAEIWTYLRKVAERFDLIRHIRFNSELLDASWDVERKRWRIETSHGPWMADVLILAHGALNEPAVPKLNGLDTFEGAKFHSACWDHGRNLAGQRVAVIGTGSSAIQFVPHIQPLVERLTVFQRTPPWVLPHTDRPIGPRERNFYRRVPLAQKLVRGFAYWSRELLSVAFTRFPRMTRAIAQAGRKHLASQIQDPELRRRLTPDYAPGCKRILLSNDYYPALAAANVELVTDGIRHVQVRSIVTDDGREHPIDTIIFGTGFKVTNNPFVCRVRGPGGQTLAEAWSEGGRAYRGTAVPGFPNLLLMTGPNTGIGHTSLVVMIEAQMAYIVQCLRTLEARRAASFEVRRAPCEAFNDRLQRQMSQTVWTTGGCRSWYLDKHGRNTTLWPDFTWKYWLLMRRFDAENYAFLPRSPGLAMPADNQEAAASTALRGG